MQCRLRGDFAFQGRNCQVKERKLAQEHIYLLLLGPHAPSLCTVKVFINSIMTLVCLFAFMEGAAQKNSRWAGKVQPKKHQLNRVKCFEEDIYLHLQTYSNNIWLWFLRPLWLGVLWITYVRRTYVIVSGCSRRWHTLRTLGYIEITKQKFRNFKKWITQTCSDHLHEK